MGFVHARVSHLEPGLFPECAGDCVGGVDPAVGVDHVLVMSRMMIRLCGLCGLCGLTSGMSLVWMQSMGLPTYCEADTTIEKASMQVVVKR